MMTSSNTSEKVVIEELQLIKFGKFDGFKINFESGLNLIYGKNEAGKSTIQLFIKAMLYGMPTRKGRGESLKERERAIPWNSARAEGIMKIHTGGRSIEIYRRFGKTAAGDKTEIRDAISGELINDFGENIGEELLGIPCGVFEKTMWIRQGGVLIDGNDEELTARLMNLQSGADENISVESALTLLRNEKRRLKASDGRSAKGRIDVLTERKEELRRAKYELGTRLAQTEKTEEMILSAKNEQRALSVEISKLEESYKKSREAERLAAVRERIKNIDECTQKLERIYNSGDYIKGAELSEADVNKMFETEKKLDKIKALAENNLKDEKEKNIKKSTAVSMMAGGGVVAAVIALFAVIFFGINANYIAAAIALTVLVISAVCGVVGIKNATNCKNIQIKMEADGQKLQEEMKGLEEERNKTLSKFGASSASDLMQLYNRSRGQAEIAASLENAKKGFLGEDSYDDLKTLVESLDMTDILPVEEIEGLLDKKRRRQIELVSEIRGLESKMAYDVKIELTPADIETELLAVENEMQECLRRMDIIEAAEDGIRRAGEEWRRSFAPSLNNRVNEIVDYLTSGRYNEVKVSEDYRMRVYTDGTPIEAEYLSCGTYEQLYFALRIASAELIGGGAPLFLDDILTLYDDERAAAALDFLNNISNLRQGIIFTCHSSDMKNAEKRGIHIVNMQ